MNSPVAPANVTSVSETTCETSVLSLRNRWNAVSACCAKKMKVLSSNCYLWLRVVRSVYSRTGDCTYCKWDAMQQNNKQQWHWWSSIFDWVDDTVLWLVSIQLHAITAGEQQRCNVGHKCKAPEPLLDAILMPTSLKTSVNQANALHQSLCWTVSIISWERLQCFPHLLTTASIYVISS